MHIINSPLSSLTAAGLCVLFLGVQPSAQSASPSAPDVRLKQTALAVPLGSPVVVEMKDKSKIAGRIGAVDDAGFDLQFLDKGTIVSKKVAFEEVKKLTPGTPKSTFRRLRDPVIAVIGMIGTAAALTAAIR